MTQEALAALVPWTVEQPPVEARVGAAVGGVLGAVLAVASLGSTGGPLAPTWDLPADPDEHLGLGLVRARGDAPWLPGGPGVRHRLRATRRLAVVDGGARRPGVPVPLTDLRVVAARVHGVGRRPRRPGARWTLSLAGAGTAEVEGAWLALAWLGHLGGWPEPTGT